jgi:hypothetical protein
MQRQLFIDCLPYLVAIVVSMGVLRLLLWFGGGQLSVVRVRRLHGDEQGAVQTLSFVLTLPLFVMVLMFIVQLSQITIGRVVLEYSALAAARSASVWIPANLGASERENQIASLSFTEHVDSNEDHQAYNVYQVAPEGPKYNKIHLAAAIACMPICPSRNYGVTTDLPGYAALSAIQHVYQLMSPDSQGNTKIPERLANKLAYALENTRVEVFVHHKAEEPPLGRQYIEPWQLDRDYYQVEFAPNEIGWQDRLEVKVTHDFALLPGPGRILARKADARPGTEPEAAYGADSVARKIRKNNRVFVYSISTMVRTSNEGEKSILPYVQQSFGSGDDIPRDDFEPTEAEPDVAETPPNTVNYDDLPSVMTGPQSADGTTP